MKKQGLEVPHRCHKLGYITWVKKPQMRMKFVAGAWDPETKMVKGLKTEQVMTCGLGYCKCCGPWEWRSDGKKAAPKLHGSQWIVIVQELENQIAQAETESELRAVEEAEMRSIAGPEGD